jgi:hypothetical protein
MEKYQGVDYFDVGTKFAELVRECLSDSEYKEMCRLNESETDTNICHSHDYCDANEIMDDVMAEFDLPKMSEESGNDFIAFWNTAWDYAKIKYFCGE